MSDSKGRSQTTGTKLGKGARRALGKNAECVDDFMGLVTASKDAELLQVGLRREALTLARVTRSPGCGRLEVTLQDGTTGVSVPIAGTIKFKGRAGTKADRSNCMCVGDVIIVRGSFASAKMTAAQASVAQRCYERLGLKVPGGFFTTTATAATAGEDDAGFEFDRATEPTAEAAAEAPIDLDEI